MPRFLMDYCINNRTILCDPRVSYSRWPKCLKRAEDIPEFPKQKAQEELDALCEACPHACFIIEAYCPICGHKKMTLAEPVKIKLYNHLGRIETNHYKCEKCGRDLFRTISPAK